MSADANLALVVVVVAPLLVLWIVALVHIMLLRPDLSVVWKAIWTAVVILTGYLGVLLYLAFRPPRPATRSGAHDPAATRVALQRLSELVAGHDFGSIGDEDFAREKAEVFGLETAKV